MCLDDIRLDDDAFFSIDVGELYPIMQKMCNYTIEKDANAITEIPDEFKTEEICMKSIKHNGINLYCVPERLKSYDICFEAVKNSPKSIENVPFKFREKFNKQLNIKEED